MLALCDVGDVLQFIPALRVGVYPARVSSGDERPWHAYLWGCGERISVIALVDILEACLVDYCRTYGLGIGDLQGIFHVRGIRRERCKIEGTNAVSRFHVPPILVSHAKRICGRQLIIEPRTQIESRLRIGNCVAERFDRKGRWIHDCRAYNGQIGDVPPLNIEEKGGLLAERSAYVGAELRCIVAGWLCSFRQIFKRVPRVESRGIPRKKELAVILVRARLGQNLDPAVTQLE